MVTYGKRVGVLPKKEDLTIQQFHAHRLVTTQSFAKSYRCPGSYIIGTELFVDGGFAPV
jgi:hypothetical protein